MMEPITNDDGSPRVGQERDLVRRAIRVEPAMAAMGLWAVMDRSRVLAVKFSRKEAARQCESLRGTLCADCHEPDCRARFPGP